MPSADLTKQLLILGCFTGLGFSLLGIGLVLIYRINGVINFGHGAIGTLGAYLAVSVSPHVHPWVALLVAVAFGMACGAVIERIGMQRVRGKLEATILTLGIMIAFQATVLLRWGVTPQRVPSLVGGGNVTFWGVTTAWDAVAIGVVAFLAAGGLYAFLRWTTVGLQMEAASQDDLGAQLNGISSGFMSLLSWVMASGLAALTAMLLARQLGLTPTTLSVLTILALVPAFIGGLRSFLLTFVGGALFGAARSYLSGYSGIDIVGIEIFEIRDALPFIIVMLVLILAFRAFGPVSRQREV